MSQQEPSPSQKPMELGPVQPKNPGGADGVRPKAPRRSRRRFLDRDDLARALEHLFGLWLDGKIDATELKVAQSALKTLADMQPKGAETQAVPISARLREMLAGDPELLNELSEVLPVDLLNAVVREKAR